MKESNHQLLAHLMSAQFLAIGIYVKKARNRWPILRTLAGPSTASAGEAGHRVGMPLRMRFCPPGGGQETDLRAFKKLRLPEARRIASGGNDAWAKRRKRCPQPGAAVRHLDPHEEALLQPRRQSLLLLRGPGHRSMRAVAEQLPGIPEMGSGQRLSRRSFHRSHRRGWQLRTVELPLGNPDRAIAKSGSLWIPAKRSAGTRS